jgi:hypothetical protein
MSPTEFILLARKRLIEDSPPSTLHALAALAKDLGVDVDDQARPVEAVTPHADEMPPKE